jgi:anti-anti-sigma regulatory factor
MALSITTNKTDGVIVVRLGGAIYFGEESSSLRIRVKELLEKSSQIVLDLENITRIDSGGLGCRSPNRCAGIKRISSYLT